MATAYEAYCTYLAVKRHFSGDSYDYHKYNGIVNASRESFEARKDILKFQKLARYKYSLPEFIAVLMRENPSIWVGKVVSPESEIIYQEYRKVVESLTYTVSSKLEDIGDLKSAIHVPSDGTLPKILGLYKAKTIPLEVLIVLDDLIHFSERYNQKMLDNPVWNSIEFKLRKFRPFMGTYDRKKITSIVKDHISSYK